MAQPIKVGDTLYRVLDDKSIVKVTITSVYGKTFEVGGKHAVHNVDFDKDTLCYIDKMDFCKLFRTKKEIEDIFERIELESNLVYKHVNKLTLSQLRRINSIINEPNDTI